MALSAFTAAVQCKCPRCRKGKVFEHGAYTLDFLRTYETCPNCGFKYEIETGFFWGAMYFTYAFSVAIFLTVYVAMTVLLTDPPVWQYVAATIGCNLIVYPLMLRYSRMCMLYFFGEAKYDPSL